MIMYVDSRLPSEQEIIPAKNLKGKTPSHCAFCPDFQVGFCVQWKGSIYFSVGSGE